MPRPGPARPDPTDPADPTGPARRRESQFTDATRRSDRFGDWPIARLADEQHAVVALRQLRLLGYSDRSIQRRAARGLLHRRYPGVYSVGHARLTAKGLWIAAVFACGDGALLSHASAAALHDLRPIPSGPVHVTAAGERRLIGIAAHAHDLSRARGAIHDAIPVTTVEQTIVDLAPVTAAPRLRTVIENGMRRDLVDFAALRTLLQARAGRPGAPRLRQILDALGDTAPRTHPGLEQHFLELVRGAALPEPLVNHVVEGVEVDFHWPAQRVIVELDGWAFHQDRRAFETDRRRDAALLAAGWRVLRITHERLTREPEEVVRGLLALLGA